MQSTTLNSQRPMVLAQWSDIPPIEGNSSTILVKSSNTLLEAIELSVYYTKAAGLFGSICVLKDNGSYEKSNVPLVGMSKEALQLNDIVLLKQN